MHTPLASTRRIIAGLGLLAAETVAVTAFALVSGAGTLAQAAPLTAACSQDAVQGLTHVGGWAADECTSGDTAALDGLLAGQHPAAVIANQPDYSRCPSAAVEGLSHVGGWAAAACMSGAVIAIEPER
jgi:hypothetical protein